MSLRYFNPVGAHASGRIGEDPLGTPNNLLPYVAQVAAGRLPEVLVFGNDFDTRDGTGERDYIHVEDPAAGHLAALSYLLNQNGYEAVNLGTGKGSTVLEEISAYEHACGHAIARRVEKRRPGDTTSSMADPRKAQRLLGWHTSRSLLDVCKSSWDWQNGNPDGYRSATLHGDTL
jgi:UDP-glucose 4-epimerase